MLREEMRKLWRAKASFSASTSLREKPYLFLIHLIHADNAVRKHPYDDNTCNRIKHVLNVLCCCVAVILSVNFIKTEVLFVFGSEAQREKLLPK